MHKDGSQNASPETSLDAAVVVRLPGALREALRQQAAREDRTLASLLRVAARSYLDRADRIASPSPGGTERAGGMDQ
jgi:hypothetical protein